MTSPRSKPNKNRIIYDSDTDSGKDDTMTADSMTISGGSDTITISPGTKLTAQIPFRRSIKFMLNKCLKTALSMLLIKHLNFAVHNSFKAVYLLYAVSKQTGTVYKCTSMQRLASVCLCISRYPLQIFVDNTLDTTQEPTVTSTKTEGEAETVLVTSKTYIDAEGKVRNRSRMLELSLIHI